ncbi:MAG: site-2 protease family protein [Candidatus Promineifilaceae bacterium]
MQSSYPITQPDPLQQITDTLRGELLGLFQVRTVATQARGRVISFGGRLLYEPDRSYDEISRRFIAHGYTPMLRREKGEDVVLAMEGVVEGSTGNPWLNLLLFLATILTTLYAGAGLSGQDLLAAVRAGSPLEITRAVYAGAPFAMALLGILGIHELGHYIAARWHRVQATLPYFIPMPIGGLGTLGAFIAIRSPMKDRKVLFDIGLAGPIAGFVVALPLMVIGLLLSTNYVPAYVGGQTLNSLGSSILSGFLIKIFTDIPVGQTLVIHPIYFAAWLGFYLTGINLLPIGQLDGGHVIYALFGRFAHTIAIIAFGALLAAGFLLQQPNWFIWAVFILFGGLRHPPPLNDLSDIGWQRKLIGLMTAVLFVLIIMPVPFVGNIF